YFDFVTFKEIINNTKFISLLFKDILTIYKDVIERIVKIPNLKEINIKDDFEILKQTRKNIRDILEYIKIQETFFYNIGKVFIREGEASKDIIYFILDGTAKISKTIYNKEIDIAYLNSGNMLGEDCLLENEKRFYTAKMGETGHVAILDKETFLKTCSIVPDLFMNIFKQQVFNLYKLEELYFSLAYKK
ncbi:MAG: cyclic nucleotide-binding domain-containing protein, partial [Leptospiraceae bacterium]|nr:cyclic nucleotide-binding domain-containing protein [Leptospiraceae bacterium]